MSNSSRRRWTFSTDSPTSNEQSPAPQICDQVIDDDYAAGEGRVFAKSLHAVDTQQHETVTIRAAAMTRRNTP
jgi:hypothetical protein